MDSLSKKQQQLALIALAVTAFAIGTTEFISVGLLPMIASDLQTTVQTAGLTVSIYAIGVVIGAPVLTLLFSSIPRKRLLLMVMMVFIVGNSIAMVSTSMVLLLVSRLVSALAHGVFMSIGSTIAASLVPKEKRASAISIMFTGLTVATITGVPFGTFIGQQVGWRFAFGFIVFIGVIAVIANWFLLPNKIERGPKPLLSEQIKLVKNKRILLILVITALGYGGTFVVFTYLSPLLQDVTGYSSNLVTVLLVLYGIMVAIGNIIGGKLSNQNPIRSLFFMFFVQAIVLIILYFTIPFKIAGLFTVLLMGLFAFMNVPGLQTSVVILAERYVPSAVDVASALNIAAFNLGIAIGSYLGGIVTNSIGLIHTSWVGGIMVLIAAGLTVVSIKQEYKNKKERL
ncbi:MFS transporter [Cytobacillus purgationiresistens]|uniref:MFS family arabinose efflux permease n=1 Tax=Cytobacillus purgationiresistens TaxID=863449 RepID=A0ABU0ABA6_9BACI|nr:putative MFS family arabinose efflux permease [Cytobacillus purgationiresistens]